MKTEITPERFEQLRLAVAGDDKQQFERLVYQIVRQCERDRRAAAEKNRPARNWIPSMY